MKKYDKLTEEAAADNWCILSKDHQWGVSDKGDNNYNVVMVTKGLKNIACIPQEKAQRILAGILKKPELAHLNFDMVDASTLELDEMSGSGGAGGYATPFAFSAKGQQSNRGIQASKNAGFTQVTDDPKYKKNTVKENKSNMLRYILLGY